MLKIAHRGASGYCPENTISAFEKAIEMGAEGIEFDIHMAKTGELVVIHDEKVNRTTNGRGLVAEKTLAELKSLKINIGETIPTLKEVLDFVADRVVLFIEIKGSNIYKALGELLTEEVNSGRWKIDNLIVISFDLKQLAEFKKGFPQLYIGPTFEDVRNIDPVIEAAVKLGPYSINLCVDEINEVMAKKVHARNLKIFFWTANKPKQIEHARMLGAAGIMSDYPDLL